MGSEILVNFWQILPAISKCIAILVKSYKNHETNLPASEILVNFLTKLPISVRRCIVSPPQTVDTKPIHYDSNLFSCLLAEKESGGHNLSRTIPRLKIHEDHDHCFSMRALAWSHQSRCRNSIGMIGGNCYLFRCSASDIRFLLTPFPFVLLAWNPLSPQEGTSVTVWVRAHTYIHTYK